MKGPCSRDPGIPGRQDLREHRRKGIFCGELMLGPFHINSRLNNEGIWMDSREEGGEICQLPTATGDGQERCQQGQNDERQPVLPEPSKRRRPKGLWSRLGSGCFSCASGKPPEFFAAPREQADHRELQ
ncbi:MAG: hypothetical protein MZV64_12810 [Ignavibacteriales bacterium]|nr:hypothetical protein [Ignavibacteriales bacterium]